MNEIAAKKIEINGIVQGVGFRPFVYRMAGLNNITGEVANTSAGVVIHAEGLIGDIDRFCRDISEKTPILAKITEMTAGDCPTGGFDAFAIVKSEKGKTRSTMISPDVSVCEDCLCEMLDPSDRRYRYPFVNCTNCGPRYTIIADVPYDRPKTSMKSFAMCPACQAEYDDPGNRRFHAQPNACPVCGPSVTLFDNRQTRISVADPILKTAKLLKAGHVLAIKGLGGFHLAADAENPGAVAKLRQGKLREEKPFAVMSYDLERIRRFAHFDEDEKALLVSFRRPIVLLKKKPGNPLAEAVSPRNRYFGVMLPYTPLHCLLLKENFTALVMTSGNISSEPICIDNGDAFDRLSGIADFFLMHNRDILLRSDDSIVRVAAESERFVRRSRGYVPVPIFLKRKMPNVLAPGAELKNTVCLLKSDRAFVSQHIGDMENLETYDFFRATIRHLKNILDIEPQAIAHDLHPDYMSTRYALEQDGIRKIAVQHHHAHIVSCMAENHADGPVIGLSFDGTGYGTDGKIWGGEVLVTEYKRFTRAAHFEYLPMPGSAAAIKEPWRMGVSCLCHVFGENFRRPGLDMWQEINEKKAGVVAGMIRKRINSPETSSLGRLFDGVAAILGVRTTVRFEGQAAMELEMLADANETATYDYAWEKGDVRKILIRPIIEGVARDAEGGVALSKIAGKFHATLIRLFTDLCAEIRKETGINMVALGGGVFQNGLLLAGMTRELSRAGFAVISNRLVPANDGGISLGQAVVAAWILDHA